MKWEKESFRKNIVEAAQLPEHEKVFMKKDVFGWRVVHPFLNEDGSKNWLNILTGGWRNLVTVIVLVLCLLGLIYAYQHDMAEVKEIVEEPCNFCNCDLKNTQIVYESIKETTNPSNSEGIEW